MEFNTVGVIGAGVMGIGVAQNLAETGHRVVLVDIDEKQLTKARDSIRTNVRMQALFQKKAPAPKPAAVLEKILFTTDYDELKVADFVVENVIEKWDVKQEVYRRIDSICSSNCIFAANTSAISITRIGSATTRPDRVLGMHFMNPVPLKIAVEVIRGYHTTDQTIATATRLLQLMGKRPIVVADSPGFVSNRVLMLTINEAIFLVQEKVALPEVVDDIFKNCFEHKMGPLETADLIGLDTILFSIEVLYDEFKDSKFRPCPLLRQMVHAGLHGRKTGRGFYNYED